MKNSYSTGSSIVDLVVVAAWIAGIVIAKGFWSTLAAIAIPPWALYLVIELAMTRAGVI